MLKCQICNKEFNTFQGLSKHLNSYHTQENISKYDNIKQYYDKYLLKDEKEKYCQFCGKELQFQNLTYGYGKLRCNNTECMSKYIAEQTKKGFQTKYGVDNVFQLESTKIKSNQKKLELHGDLNFNNREKANETLHSKSIEELKEDYNNRKTNKKKNNNTKYGVDNVFQLESIKEKSKDSCRENYGVDNYAKTEKHKQFLQDNKYEFIQKTKKINMERYNNPNYNNIEKAKITNLEIYGDKSSMGKNSNIRKDIENACKEKYGVYPFSKTQQYKDLYKNKEFVSDWQRKIYYTKKKNHTHKSSKQEKLFEQMLIINNIKYIYQHRDEERYPFNCDFYLSDIDLFIELNFYYTHGNKPYNILDKTEDKLLKSEVYTITDPLKRQIAIQNNLNYIEVFNSYSLDKLINFIQNDYKDGYACLI